MKPDPSIRTYKNQVIRTACTLLIYTVGLTSMLQAQTQNVLARFTNANGGGGITLVQGTDGNFYGAGITGGHNNGGSIFRVTPSGAITRLYVFCPVRPCQDGFGPNGLVLASDGNLYGTTNYGGTGSGTIFQVTTSGILTTLYVFCTSRPCGTDGYRPYGELIQGSDGNLYGTTSGGGKHGAGTVFQISLSGVFTSLYSFCSQPNCADGANPMAGLVEASNGMFYGTTSTGGSNAGGTCTYPGGCGTLFRISPSGSFKTLYSFCAQTNCADGMSPQTSLIQASDANLYGETNSGGAISASCLSGCGVAFRIPVSGAPYTLLHSFADSEGSQVQNLIQATDGNFYGTARLGGSLDQGTLFKMNSAGSVAVLWNFCNAASCNYSTNPVGLMQATNGLFYGTTLGPGNGLLFTYGFQPFVRMSPTGGPVGTMVRIYGTDLTGATGVTFNGGIPATFTIVSPGEIDTTVPAGALWGPIKVFTPAATLQSNVVFRVP